MLNHQSIRRANSAVAIRAQRSRYSNGRSRRGVLLLVVLSMLVLFMLIGTAFLMSSGQEQKSAKSFARADRVGNPATKRLERALLQVLRDTDNQYSAVRYHSLLRDMYGTGGFQGVVYSPTAMDLTKTDGQVTRYADGKAANPALPLDTTNGQFIDIYVRALGWNAGSNQSLNDPQTADDEAATGVDLRHIVKLDRDPLGRSVIQPLSLARGYYNGCVLTITSGPAAGQSTRILDYEYLGDIQPIAGNDPTKPTYFPSRLYRFRVLSFPRTDGQPLQIAKRPPELDDLAGATFLVNGRAFSGTGAGYNPLAQPGQPRLNAVEFFYPTATDAIGAEVALLPNAVYFDPLNFRNVIGVTLPGADPFASLIPPAVLSTLPKLNTVTTGPNGTTYNFSYGTYGDMNESYDAADFQNMFLALLTVTPRAQGRVVQNGSSLSAFDPALDANLFQRLDLEDLPIPSFHRPDLMNFWYNRMFNSQWLTTAISDPEQRALAILDPYPNGKLRSGLTPTLAQVDREDL